jgi:hypothetical protein
MRILNFHEFSRCYSTENLTRWCRLHWQVRTPRCSLHRWVQIIGVAYTGDSTNIFFSQKLTCVGFTRESGLTSKGYIGESGPAHVGYTGKSRLPVVGYTGKSRHPGLAYTGESLVQPSRPANALKGTIP